MNAAKLLVLRQLAFSLLVHYRHVSSDVYLWITMVCVCVQVWSSTSSWWDTLHSGMRTSTDSTSRSKLELMMWVLYWHTHTHTHSLSLSRNILGMCYIISNTPTALALCETFHYHIKPIHHFTLVMLQRELVWLNHYLFWWVGPRFVHTHTWAHKWNDPICSCCSTTLHLVAANTSRKVARWQKKRK